MTQVTTPPPVATEDEVERVALAIERANREPCPDNGGFDHPEISDWGIHLARAAIASFRDNGREAGVDLATVAKCVAVAERVRDEFLSPEYATPQPVGSFSERFACTSVIDALRDEFALGSSARAALQHSTTPESGR